MNRQLKVEILTRFNNQADCAAALAINESRLSRLIRERVRPSERELKAFTRIFGSDRVNTLFGVEDRPEGSDERRGVVGILLDQRGNLISK